MEARNQSENASSLILRMIPPPYTTLRTLKIAVSPEWKSVSQSFSLEQKSPHPLGLFLIPDGEGNLDIRRISLEELGAEESGRRVLLETRFVEALRDCSPERKRRFPRRSARTVESGFHPFHEGGSLRKDRESGAGTLPAD